MRRITYEVVRHLALTCVSPAYQSRQCPTRLYPIRGATGGLQGHPKRQAPESHASGTAPLPPRPPPHLAPTCPRHTTACKPKYIPCTCLELKLAPPSTQQLHELCSPHCLLRMCPCTSTRFRCILARCTCHHHPHSLPWLHGKPPHGRRRM